jgi:hypothetical protein
MTSIAASRPRELDADKPQKPSAGLFHSPVVATALLGAFITALGWFVGPMVARAVQSHEKVLEVRSTLATDMSKSFTMAVGAGQRVASGLIYGPTGDRRRNAAVVQSAYNTGLGQWQVDGGRITAELSARYTGNDIVTKWQGYRLAVTRFYRLSAALPAYERQKFVGYVKAYFDEMKDVSWAPPAISAKVDWAALRQSKKFRKSLRYRQAYDEVSTAFLSLGDAFVEQLLTLHPEV